MNDKNFKSQQNATRDSFTSAGGVGDLHSDKKGTAARYNSGKPRTDLLPLYMVVESVDATNFNQYQLDALESLKHIAMFQSSGEELHIDAALRVLSKYWAECANAFGYGAIKYASWNWTKGMMWSVPIGCIGRHSLNMFNGEMLDKESGINHLGHIMCNVVMLKLYFNNYKEGNDLPPKSFGLPEAEEHEVYKLKEGFVTFYFGTKQIMEHVISTGEYHTALTSADIVMSDDKIIKCRYPLNDIIETYIKATQGKNQLIA